jgi:hypothetical protein
MVTGGADREGDSPEITELESADGFVAPAGNTRACAKASARGRPGVAGSVESHIAIAR